MNTPAHLIVGMAAFGRPESPRLTIGALIPDLSLYLLAGWHLGVLGTPASVVFGQLYYSDGWQRIFAVDNSFILFGALFGVALWRRWPWVVALSGAAILHLVLDFPLHNHDARMHFWPLTTWKFESPISYWERTRGAAVVEIVEMTLVASLTVWLIVRYRMWAWRAVFVAIAGLQLLPFVMWRLMF